MMIYFSFCEQTGFCSSEMALEGGVTLHLNSKGSFHVPYSVFPPADDYVYLQL